MGYHVTFRYLRGPGSSSVWPLDDSHWPTMDTAAISFSNLSSMSEQPLHCHAHPGTLPLFVNGAHRLRYDNSHFLSFSSRPRMKSAPSPRAPRGLWAWSAITAALALKVFAKSVVVINPRAQWGSTHITQNLDHLFFVKEL
jgi:hypothetical protein